MHVVVNIIKILPCHSGARANYNIGEFTTIVLYNQRIAWTMLESPASLLRTGYGRLLALKLVFVIGLLTLTALNKLRLVPAFAGEQAAAASSLRRSIAAEILLASAIVRFNCQGEVTELRLRAA